MPKQDTAYWRNRAWEAEKAIMLIRAEYRRGVTTDSVVTRDRMAQIARDAEESRKEAGDGG